MMQLDLLAFLPEIYDLLYRLGAAADHTGFFYTSYTVLLSVENPQRLLLANEWLYPEAAKHYHAAPQAVERGIQCILSDVWDTHSGLLSEFAGHFLEEKPSAIQFIAILAAVLTANTAA